MLLSLSPLAEGLASALPVCPVREALGLPCLTCGATRSALALANLDLLGAISINPLVSLAWIVLVPGGLIAGVLSLLGVAVKEPSWRFSLPTRWLLVSVLLANWIYLVGAGI